MASRTFAKIYESVNRSTKDFSAIGRAKQAEAQKAAEVAESEANKIAPVEFKSVDIEALRVKSDGDPLVEVLAEMQDQNKVLFDEVKKLSIAPVRDVVSNDALEQANAKEIEVMEKELDIFFKDENLKPYQEFYGVLADDSSTWENLTPGQKANRLAAIREAEMTMIGAEISGVDIPLSEALRRAHLVVSEPLREKIFREDVVKHLTKREKAISLRPSGKVTDTESGAKTEDKLVQVTKQRLQKVFNR